MTEKNHKKIKSTAIVIACMSLFWFASMWLFQLNRSTDIEKHVVRTLVISTQQEANDLTKSIERAFAVLNIAARELDVVTEMDFSTLEEAMRYCVGLERKPKIWVASADDLTLAAKYLKDLDVQRVLQGDRVLSGPILKDGKEYYSIAVPVVRQGKVVAALGSIEDAQEINGALLNSGIMTNGYCMVVSKNNEVISIPPEDVNWWTEHGMLKDRYTANPYNSLMPVNGDNIEGTDGVVVYMLGSGKDAHYVTACPFKINGWTLLGAVSRETVLAEYAFANKNLIALNIVMLCGFLVMITFLIRIWGRERQVVQEERNRLAWLEERYRIVARESDDVIFEISLQEKLIEANENFHKLLGYNVVQWNRDYLNRVHPDDEQKFAAIYEGIKAGKRLMKEELRFRRADGTYLWCRLLVAILLDAKGKPARALGKITNIDTQKREAAWLRQKAQQDALTNLYNKETTHNMIRRYLEADGVGGVHGLIVMDVDNFKEINDTRGHLYGDAVLAAVADKLRMQFRSTDIVGRIGGDEFLVFLKNVNSRAQLEAQAAALQHAFAASSGKDMEYPISCSIGASTYPEDGASIELLFQNADMALYRAKRQGKGRYAMFRWEMDARHQENGKPKPPCEDGKAQENTENE